MANKLILFICIVVLTILSCQDNNKLNKDLTIKYYPNSKNMESAGYYYKDKPVGIFKNYDSSGKLQIIEHYDSSGILNGKFISFTTMGDTDQIGFYKDGKLDSIIAVSYTHLRAHETDSY